MTKDDMLKYLDNVRRVYEPAIYISRQFRAREDWDRDNSFDSVR